MVATSATRDAKNQQEFFDMTAELLGQIQPGAQAEVVEAEVIANVRRLQHSVAPFKSQLRLFTFARFSPKQCGKCWSLVCSAFLYSVAHGAVS